MARASCVGKAAPDASVFILLTMDFTETDRATEKITANVRIVITRYLPLNDVFFNGIKPLDREDGTRGLKIQASGYN